MDGMHVGVGLSLFQGSPQLQLDPSADNALEEEAVADQQRRDHELQQVLTNAFDDLQDDDDRSTLSSIAASEHNSHGEGKEEIVHDDIITKYHAALFPDANKPPFLLERRDGANKYRTDAFLNKSDSRIGIDSFPCPINISENPYAPQGVLGAGDSTSVLHYQHCFRTSPKGRTSNDFPVHEDNENFRQAGFMEREQLEVLYEVRVREVARLTHQLEVQAQAAVEEKENLRRQITIKEAEKERAQLLYQQAQSLLVESKDKISYLEKQVLHLETTVKSLEISKADLTEKLDASRLSIEDLHQKILLLERGNLNNTDKHLDTFLHNVQAIHTVQMKKLEDELALAVSKLNSKEAESDQQKQDSLRRQQQLEACLAEKGDMVNHLARSLEEAQRHCQEMMTQNSGQEIACLRMKLNAAEKDCAALTQRLEATQRDSEVLRSDIKQYEAFVKEELMQDASDQDSEPFHGPGFSSNKQLKEELQRALMGLKQKREEIAQLSSELEIRSQELRSLSKQEEQMKLNLQSLQEDLNRKEDCLLEANREIDKQKGQVLELRGKITEEQKKATKAIEEEQKQRTALVRVQEHNQLLKEEVKTLKNKVECINDLQSKAEVNLRTQEQHFSQTVQQLKEEHSVELKKIRMTLDQTHKENNEIKELYIKLCNSKEELVNSLQKGEIKIKELEAEIVHLKAECEKSDQLQPARRSIDFQKNNYLLFEELEKGKNNLDAAQKAILEISLLKTELKNKEIEMKTITNHYNEELKKIRLEKDQAVEELERSKENFALKVSEEIDKAKIKAVEELKKNWKDNCSEEESNSKIKQCEEEVAEVQQRLLTAVQRHAEDTAALVLRLEEAKENEERLATALTIKDEELNKLKLILGSDFSESSEIHATDKVKKGVLTAFAAKLKAEQSQHQLQLEETTERVKEETMRFCVQQIHQVENKYLSCIKKYKDAYESEINRMYSAWTEDKSKLSKYDEKLRDVQQQLDKERLQLNSVSELKAKLIGLEQELNNIESKAEKTERCLEVTSAKYQAAKKAVHKYKKYTEAHQKHMEKEWDRINAGFLQTLSQVQEKLIKLTGQNNTKPAVKDEVELIVLND